MFYDAFISYRHIDRDSFIADKLQHELEHYRIPKKIRKLTGKEKIGRVFRDKEELPISEDLGKDIQDALDNAEFLIVICSPEARESAWVHREIKLFLAKHDRKHVLAVLAEGTPETSFPEELLFSEKAGIDEDGRETTEKIPVEPLAADARGSDNKARQKNLNQEKLRLLAAMLGCRFDDLKQREREYRMRRRMIIGGTLLAAVSGFLVYALLQNAKLQAQYRAKQLNESRYLAEVSGSLLDGGERIKALQVAEAALPESEENLTRPVAPEAVYALNNALHSYTFTDACDFSPEQVFEMDNLSVSDDTAVSPSGRYFAAADCGNHVYVYDLNEEKCVMNYEMHFFSAGSGSYTSDVNKIVYLGFMSDSEVMIASAGGIACVAFPKGDTVWSQYFGELSESEYEEIHYQKQIALTADRKKLAFYSSAANSVISVDAQKGTKIAAVKMPQDRADVLLIPSAMSFDQSGNYLMLNFAGSSSTGDASTSDRAVLFDMKNRQASEIPIQVSIHAMQFISPDQYVTVEYSLQDAASLYDVPTSYSICCRDRKTNKTVWHTEHITSLNAETKPLLSITDVTVGGQTIHAVAAAVGKDFTVMGAEDGTLLNYSIGTSEIKGFGQFDGHRFLTGVSDGSVNRAVVTDHSQSDSGTIDTVSRNINAKVSRYYYIPEMKKSVVIKQDSNQLIICRRNYDDSIKNANLNGQTLSGVGYLTTADNRAYRVIQTRKGNDDQSYTAMLYRVGENEPFAEISTDSGSYFEAWGSWITLYGPESDLHAAYVTEPVDYTKSPVLHTYSLKEQKETWSMQLNLNEDEQEVSFFSNDGVPYAAIYSEFSNNGEFGIVNLQSGSMDLSFGKHSDGTESMTIKRICSANGKLFLVSANGSQCERKTWDIKNACFSDTPYSTMTSDSVDISDDQTMMACYSAPDILIMKTDDGEVLHRLPFSGHKKCLMKFMLGDKYLLTYGDSGYLQMWNLEKEQIVCEENEIHADIDKLNTDRDEDYFGVTEKIWTVDYAFTSKNYIYSLNQNGRFYRYADIGQATASFRSREILTTNDEVAGYYRFKSLDELLAESKAIIGDRTMSEMEKQKYYLSSS